MKITIILNGTDTNPFLKYGLLMNPFPAIPKRQYAAVNLALARLAAEPLSGPDDIRRILEPVVTGAAGEQLIAACCEMFKKGERVEFDVTYPDKG